MMKFGKQILYWLVLVITGMALVGVNVTQSGCVHSDQLYLEVRVIPTEEKCPCGKECICCCGQEDICEGCCHASARHDFYKVTDSSVVERVLQMGQWVCVLPELLEGMLLKLPAVEGEKELWDVCRKIPNVPPSLEWLCTFLC